MAAWAALVRNRWLLRLLALRCLLSFVADAASDDSDILARDFFSGSRPTATKEDFESAMLSSFGQTLSCYNSSHCTFPSICTLESPYRRYCSDTRFVTTPGRTLFDLTGAQQPGAHGCVSCASPIALVDFNDRGEFGANACRSFCDMPTNSSAPDAVVESFQTSNCRAECSFERGELMGSAVFGTSPHFEGEEPTEALLQLRAAVRWVCGRCGRRG